MGKWQVFERYANYRVGRWYKTFFLRRWKIDWYGFYGSHSDHFTVEEYKVKRDACLQASQLNQIQKYNEAYKKDYWKEVECNN